MLQTISTTAQATPALGGRIHIDRMTFCGPLKHEPLGDLIYKHFPDLGWVPVGASAYTPKRRRNALPDEMFVKSYDVQDDELAYKIRFDCCPPQVLQGHNVFGHANALDYVNAIFEQQLAKHGRSVTPTERDLWRTGRLIYMSEVHLCGNFWFPPHLKAMLLDAIDQANRSGKHRDIVSCITLGFGPTRRSNAHTLCLYDKLPLLLKEWGSPGTSQAKLLELADGSIRIEVRLYEGGLAHRNLKSLQQWINLDVDAVFFELLAGYNVSNAIQPLLTADEEKMLGKSELVTYTLWLLNQDLDRFLSLSTICRHRKSIKKATGMDIRSHRRPERLPVVDLSELLVQSNIVQVPDWLLESDRFWKVGQRA